MKKIFILITALILSGCQSASETNKDFYPQFSSGSNFTYQGQKYTIAYAKQNGDHILKIMKENNGFFLLSDASKQEAAIVSMDFVRFNICKTGDVKLLNIIEADRSFGKQDTQLTRYVATFKCQFD